MATTDRMRVPSITAGASCGSRRWCTHASFPLYSNIFNEVSLRDWRSYYRLPPAANWSLLCGPEWFDITLYPGRPMFTATSAVHVRTSSRAILKGTRRGVVLWMHARRAPPGNHVDMGARDSMDGGRQATSSERVRRILPNRWTIGPRAEAICRADPVLLMTNRVVHPLADACSSQACFRDAGARMGRCGCRRRWWRAPS